MSDTCAGACCAVFPIHKTRGGVESDPQWDQIKPMLVPLTRRQAVRRYRRLGYGELKRWGKNYNLYTCKNWDEQTRLCGIYETRPNMCRDYPYEGRTCERNCGYSLNQADCDRIAERKDGTWRWDVEGDGWRPRTNSAWVWDEQRGMLVAR